MIFQKGRWNSQANQNYLQFEKDFIAVSNYLMKYKNYSTRLFKFIIEPWEQSKACHNSTYLKLAHCAVYAAKESKANIRLLCDKKSHLNGNLAHFSWSESEPNLSPTKSAHLMQSTYLYSLLNLTSYPKIGMRSVWSSGTKKKNLAQIVKLIWL